MLKPERQRWHPMRTLWPVWTVVWLSAHSLSAQAPPLEKCVFEGIARDAITQLPVSKATIRLFPGAGDAGYSGTSNRTGAFHFEGVAPGDYVLTVERAGYSSGWVLTGKAGRPISKLHLVSAQSVTETELWLTPDGEIAGKVLGPDGEPLAGAQVDLITRKWERGQRVYQLSTSEDSNAAGEYHFSRVAPGRYFAYARRPFTGPLELPILEAPGNPEMRIVGRYHPDSSELEGATPIEVRAGQEVSGIDIRLPLVPTFHLRGNAESQPASERVTVALAKRSKEQALEWDVSSFAARKDGSFDLAGVTPGSYFLYSVPMEHSDLDSPKIPFIMTAKDAAGILAPKSARFSWRGRTRVEGGSVNDAMSVTIFCEGSDAGFNLRRGRTRQSPDGTFEIDDLAPDRYSIHINNWTGRDQGLYLKSVRVNGVDIHGTEIDMTAGPAKDVELILSKDVGTLEGTLQWPEDGASHPATATAAELTVVVVPDGLPSGDSFPLTAQPDQDGRFRITGLAPGHYRAFALTHYDQGLWQNPVFVSQMAGRGVALEVMAKGIARIEVKAVPASEVRQVEDAIP